MNTTLVDFEVVDLLSRITGQKLSQRDITPSVIFLTALITVLLGVMLVDNTITDEEKQRWQKTINRFIPPEGNVRQLTQLISKGVRQNQVYTKLDQLMTLTAPLSEPEKLLLVSFGYEMSAADGEMDAREKKYLEAIAKRLEINPQHLAILDAGFTHKKTVAPPALDEVQSLLDPARFQSLDAVFVKAARDMLAALPVKPEYKGTQQRLALSYRELQRFQGYRQQLETACKQLAQIIQDGTNDGVLPGNLAKEIEKASDKLKSQRFRLAVVGEFSQGKSTLLNALLGEEIQPVREIPCSGTVTVLKYGAQRRVVCRYKDGRSQEIPFDQYQEKAAISEEAALGCLSDELAHFEIEEIIFEHPDLELCRNGVEIIDSPGLNEHPDRTAITQKLLKDTDAAIFLTNASRSLTQGERDLLQDLRTQLKGGKEDEPADNLFVVGNFMDLVRTEKGRQQVQQRIERFVQGQSPIITGENRIHFISAQATLDAIVKGSENEYLKTFQNFTQSIEKFLTLERGSLQVKQSVTKLKGLIQACLDQLHQAEDVLDGKLKITEEDKHKIFEQMGEASGRDVRIQLLAEQLIERSCEQAEESWNEWAEGLGERIARKSEHWYSDHNQKEKLFQDYGNQFIQDLSAELNAWVDKKIKGSILQPNTKVLDSEIRQGIEAIQRSLQILDLKTGSNLSNQLDLSLSAVGVNMNIDSSIGSDITDAGGIGFFGSLGTGGLVAGALLAFTGLGLIPVALAGGAAALGLGWLFGEDQDAVRAQIKQSVFEQGFEKFNESAEQVFDKVCEHIASAFYNRVEAASGVIEQAISLSENLLEQQERLAQETLEQCKAEKSRISQKRQELEQVQSNIEAILNQCTG